MNDANQNSAVADKTLDQLAADIAAYQPPAVVPTPSAPSMSAAPAEPASVPSYVAPSSVAPATPAAPAVPAWSPAPAAPMAPSVSAASVAPSPAPMATPSAAPAPTSSNDKAESLEAQNIFELLGVSGGSDTDKESFLDELQQVIWEDFLTSDIQLLLTRAELAEVQTIRAQNQDPAKQQEAVVTYLEKLIPDMENIMLEKALELKREMVNERITGMRSYLAAKPDQVAALDKVQELVRQDKWASVTRALNVLAAS